MIVIPAIDLIGSRAVRLRQGSFDDVTVYDDAPLEIARRYATAGARWLHVVDLEGSRAGAPVHAKLVAELAAIEGLHVQVGGGLRSPDAIRRVLAAGAARAVVGSLAVRNPEVFRALLEELGAERVVLAADVRIDGGGTPRVATGAWRNAETISADTLLGQFPRLRHVLCTDIGRDGMLGGPNLDLYGALIRRNPDLCIQASGGVSSLADLARLRSVGVDSVIVGRALLDGRFTAREALAC